MKNEKLAYIKKDTDDQTNGYISFKDGANIRIPEAIGYLRHEEIRLKIDVYAPISLFKRLMLKWCFGLKYKKVPKSRN